MPGKVTPSSAEVQYWAYKQQRTRELYFRILFELYEQDMLPPNYIAPHLRSPKVGDDDD